MGNMEKFGKTHKAKKAVIIGGGWAGCSAAIRTKKQGFETVLIEKTDLLLGLGNVGGIFRNNGRWVGAEENIMLGAGELFEIMDKCATHKNVDFPGHKHASFYDIHRIEPEVRKLLISLGIEIKFMTRAVDVILDEEKTYGLENQPTVENINCGLKTDNEKIATKPKKIKSIITLTQDLTEPSGYKKETITADVFIETTGSAGGMGNCTKYGNGCSMCILRCPAFGARVSLTEKAGVPDISAERPNGKLGAFSGSGKLIKETLSPKLQKKLNKDGFCVIPLPKELINRDKLTQKVCQQYALPEFAENIILIDTGEAKIMTPYFNLENLRKIEGFERAKYVDPYAGGKANSIRYMGVCESDCTMRAKGFENVFVGGEKAGFFVGHTEAITTGALAGYNIARYAEGKELLTLPRSLAIGDMIAFASEARNEPNGLTRRFTLAGGEYFARMKEQGTYTIDKKAIKKRVESEGLLDIYNN